MGRVRVRDEGAVTTMTIHTCPHEHQRNLYEQRRKKGRRGFRAAARKCDDCGAVFPTPNGGGASPS